MTRARLLHEQHVPREPVALARPAVVAGVGEVAERQGELHHHPQPTASTSKQRRADAPRATPRHRHRSTERGPSRRRGQSGSKNTVDAPIISHGNTPIGNSAQVHTWNADQHEPGRRAASGATAAAARSGSRTTAPAIAKACGRRRDADQAPEHRHVAAGRAATARAAGRAPASRTAAWPGRRRRRPRPPGSGAATPSPRATVAGPPGRRASRLRARPSGATTARAADQGEEPVVVEVGRGVDQLDPPEGHQQRRRPPAGCASRATQRRRGQREQRRPARASGAPVGCGTHAEAEVGEAVGRAGVERRRPSRRPRSGRR